LARRSQEERFARIDFLLQKLGVDGVTALSQVYAALTDAELRDAVAFAYIMCGTREELAHTIGTTGTASLQEKIRQRVDSARSRIQGEM
jgi:hypothetical protein